MAILALLVSCSEEEIVKVTPTNGQEVKFSVSMDKVASRTLYGAVADDGKSIKVNWVDGDEITVFGTTCAVQQANYKVSTKDANGIAATDQNYASSLEKTGAAGVQWGSDNVSEFFAIYPAVEGAFSNNGSSVTVDTEIKEIQHAEFEKNDDGVWVGTPYADNVNNLGMENALMYAYKKVNYSDTKGVVDLNFKPFSTVLKFKLSGWTLKDDKGLEITLPSTEKVYINKITLYAPDETTISGPCSFTFKKNEKDEMTVIADGGRYGTITLYPDMLALLQGESVEFNVFAIPKEYTMNSSDPWVVEVETANYGIRQFSIKPTVAQTLEEGQIHNVNIPKIEFYEQFDLTEYKNEWMKYIPRNVYLSELSIPGAWYATDDQYQSSTDLTKQFENGIRAFNIDCRLTYGEGKNWYNQYDDSELNLVCAGTDDAAGIGSINKLTDEGETVLSKLQLLSNLLNSHKDEFIYVVLTIAEKPLTFSSTVFGNVDPSQVLSKIKEALDNSALTNLYKGSINSNTTLNDVLGKVVVKINVNTTQDKFANYSTLPSYALISQASMAANSNYISGDIVKGEFTKMNSDLLYWDKSLIDPNMTYYYHQAQHTEVDSTKTSGSSTPSLYDRQVAINDIIAKSLSIWKDNKHNGLFQLGLGGYTGSSGNEQRTIVAQNLNRFVFNKISEKLKDSPSPIGIVLMNYCTDNYYKSEDLTNALITLNTKFYLNRDKTQDEWPNGNPFGGGEPQ